MGKGPSAPAGVYPPWSVYLGWTLRLSSILAIPVTAIYQLATTPGSLMQRLRVNLNVPRSVQTQEILLDEKMRTDVDL